MVLTAILTAISDRSGVFAGVRCRLDSLTGKDFRTMAYGSGRGAGNWGSRAIVLVLPATIAMILPSLMILCCP